MLVEELRTITEKALETKPEWSETDWSKYHLKVVVNRLKTQAGEGYHSCYFPHLTEEEEGYLSNQGLKVTKKTKNCSCLMGNGWFVDWFDEGSLEKLQKEVDELYCDEE